MLTLKNLLCLPLMLFCLFGSDSQAKTWSAPGSKADETQEQFEERIHWWRQARFGLFVHWGPVSLTGEEIGWSRGGERRGRPEKNNPNGTPVEIYDNLYKHFNPSLFDAHEWVKIAKDAGMKYLVFTTKHHDGFCNFDTRLTDYKITSPEANYGTDIVEQLAIACHQAGIGLGFYYSQPDWYHPDYRTDQHDRYIEYLHCQIKELSSRYGKVDIIWFDGLGGQAEDWDAENLFKLIHTCQPHALINNRAGLPGDFGTPEQIIGTFQMNPPWESCITIGTQWAWKAKDNIKPTKQCLQTLIRTVGGDGNLLFNVGPMPDGRIEPRQVERLREMGDWLDQYGETIYGTRGGPFKPTDWGTSTRKGKKIYLHVLHWYGKNPQIKLPLLDSSISRWSLLTGGHVEFVREHDHYRIDIPQQYVREIDTIIELELEDSAMDIEPIDPVPQSLSFGQKSAASSEIRERFGAHAAFNGDWVGRGWIPRGDDPEPCIKVDMGKPHTIEKIILYEQGNQVKTFQLQTWTDNNWKTFHTGTTIGEQLEIGVPSLKTSQVRLVLQAEGRPSIKEMVLLGEE